MTKKHEHQWVFVGTYTNPKETKGIDFTDFRNMGKLYSMRGTSKFICPECEEVKYIDN